METRAAKRRANAANLPNLQTQPLKKKRVVLGELPNLPNLTVPPNPKCLKNPRVKKVTATKKTLSSSSDSSVDATIKGLDDYIVIDANSTTLNTKFNVDPQNGNPFVHDIYSYLRAMEKERKRRPTFYYMEKVQYDVNANMRGVLVDWLVEVAQEYKLLSDTLFLSVLYIDRFLSLHPVPKSRFQLLGISSILIAAKYDEITPPHVEELCSITDNTYNKHEVVHMEASILKSLGFEMGNPTVNTFVRRFTEVACENNKGPKMQFEFLCKYLAELSLLEYSCLKFLPSLIAASATFLARYIIWPKVHPWTSSLCKCTGYNVAELKECVLILHDLYLERRGESLPAIRKKYQQHKFKCVANLPSPPQLPNSLFDLVSFAQESCYMG